MDELPAQCNYLNLGAARIREIKSIEQKLDECRHGKIAFQNLPRHMQRRAVSSNPKRVPRDLRHLQKITQPVEKKQTKRPSRKYRRRPKNLLSEYNRRQKNNVWLETHIWHAKRFHMKKKWGYVIPESPTQKAYRSSLRAATQWSLVQDVSYLNCIELHGGVSLILSGMASITDPESIALISSSVARQGKQWYQFTLYKPEKKPFEAVCDVDFLWHPSKLDGNETNLNKLWMWVHPVCYKQVIEILSEIFSLNPFGHSDEHIISNLDNCKGDKIETLTDMEEKSSVKFPDTEMIDPILKSKIESRNVPFNRAPKYFSQKGDVTMILLKDTLNRFRLIGPDSYKNLTRAFHPMKINADELEKDQTEKVPDQLSFDVAKEFENIEMANKDMLWWKNYYNNLHSIEAHKQQVQAWERIVGCQVTSRIVLPLCIRDPRVTLPVKKNIPLENESTLENTKELFPSTWPIQSPIFDSCYRDSVTGSKVPDGEINKQRSSLLVPGSNLPETPQEAKLPLLIMMAPSSGTGATGAQYDVIVPCGWGMNVWMSLVYNCCATAGQEQEFSLHLEANTRLPPYLQPDTEAYQDYTKEQTQERENDFFKRPPNCRVNFIKLGIQFPFWPPWEKLIKAWSPGVQDYFILRDNKVLSNLAQLIGNASKQNLINRKRKASSGPSDRLKIYRKGEHFQKSDFSKKIEIDDQLILNQEGFAECDINDEHKDVEIDMKTKDKNDIEDMIKTCIGNLSRNCLVKVSLVLKGKGIIEPCAMVCLPTEEDLKEYKSSLNMIPSEQREGPTEGMHEDTKIQLRKDLKLEHKKIQGTLRRHRKKAAIREQSSEKERTSLNDSLQDNSYEGCEQTVKSTDNNLEEKYKNYNKLMNKAWLMDENTNLQCCSRLIIGYVAHGNFSYSRGCGAGYGWVGLTALLNAFKVSKDVTESYKKTDGTGIMVKNKTVKGELLVLLRNPSSLQYRWARIFIMINQQ